MVTRDVLMALVLAVPLSAQPSVDRLVERIEHYSALQERRLGLDTRLMAAARLRVIAPAAARRLLEGGLPALPPKTRGEGDYFTFRLLRDYAALDIDAAEKAIAPFHGQAWAHTALIDQATHQRDFARAIRYTRSAVEAGQYSLGATILLLQTLQKEEPARVAALQDELVRGFPVERATLSSVRSLLEYVGVNPPIDPKRGQEAARVAFQALDRPGIRPASAEFEETATFSVGQSKIETKTSFDTVLLPAAAFLAVFRPDEYRNRISRLPDWGPKLGSLTAADLPGLLKARRVRTEVRPPASDQPAPPRIDFAKLSYDEVIAAAQAAAPLFRLAPLLGTARRRETTREQQEKAYRLALDAVPGVQGAGAVRWRCFFLADIFADIAERRMDTLFPAALTQYVSALDEAVRSDDRALVSEHDLGGFGRRYAALARILDERGVTLQTENPAIEAQRVLREIERLQLPAQDFALPSQDGETVRLSDLRGKVVVLDFWATWCEPCRKAMPDLAAIAREFSPRGVVVLGVDDETPEVVREFATANQLPFATLIDRGRKAHDLFGVNGIPAAIVIGRDGMLVDRVSWPHNAAAFRAALRKAGVE